MPQVSNFARSKKIAIRPEDRPAPPARIRVHPVRENQTLIAALDVHSGRVIDSCTNRRTQADRVAFMEQVARAYLRGRIHIIWDHLHASRSWSLGRLQYPPQTTVCRSLDPRRMSAASIRSNCCLEFIPAAFYPSANPASTEDLHETSPPRGHSPALSKKLANPRILSPMPKSLTVHQQATAKPYGKHRIIQMNRDDGPDTVARLTEVAPRGTRLPLAVTPSDGSLCQRKEISTRTTERVVSLLEPDLSH